jgi:hypothetical protein
MNRSKDQDIHGGCYCGGVRFSIAAGVRPHFAGYCHCRDCRQSHSAPLYQYAYVKASEFRISEGEDLLKWHTRSEAVRNCFKRYFCGRCGSRVYNAYRVEQDGTTLELRGAFPSLFDDQELATNATWSPREHLFCAESIMDASLIQDGLPKFDGDPS